jgi:hypothetical protein
MQTVFTVRYEGACSFLNFHVLLTCGYSYIIAVADCTRREAEEDSCAQAVSVGIG